MPQRSRDRHRGYEPERQHERDRRARRQRQEREEYNDDDNDGYEDEEEYYRRHNRGDVMDDYDEEYDEELDRRHRRRDHRASRSRPRHYDNYERYDDHDRRGAGDDDDASDGEVIVVDSRPNFARPPAVQASPARVDPRPHPSSKERSRGYQRDYRYKAKESPATSPVKKRDRERDREGRRRRDSTADEGSPTMARLKDRRRHADRDMHAWSGDDREREHRRARRRDKEKVKEKHASSGSANSATQLLSMDALSKLNARNTKMDSAAREREAKEEKAWKEKERKRKKKESILVEKARGRHGSRERRDKSKKRLVSGVLLEEGRSPELRVRGGGGGGGSREKWRRDGGGGDDDEPKKWFRGWSKKKKIALLVGILVLLLVIIIPVAVVVSKKQGGEGDKESDDSTTSGPSKDELKGIKRDSIPSDAKGTDLDPFSWYDTADFNVTYTDETVGGLPIMGLNSTWDDSAQANEHVPPLDEKFPYGKQVIRGVNVGGWLCIEPFITPSFFDKYSSRENVVDEYTLAKKLGSSAKGEFEKHYATFITEKSFKEIRDAGLDHVRIPYGYWAVKTFDEDDEGFIERLSWRYLLRAIEYCRKYGLRVSLDLHAVPGSQNGWNHSGRSGKIKWLNGSDGDKNAKRSLEIHDQLSKFFAQARYKNVVTIYGLANEPMMLKIKTAPVIKWTNDAADIIEKNGMKQWLVFGDGFLKLSKWKTMLQDTDHKFILDTHQYTVFNTDLIGLNHKKKLEFVCDGWVDLISNSNSKDKGWGPTINGEWSQADTDCTKYLNNVNAGSRWTGTMDDPSAKDQVVTPMCPTAQSKSKSKSTKTCSCDPANADPSEYSKEYKTFLKAYAEAQMYAFEKGWGWFYWTWETESATQWSWRRGREAGILPDKAYAPEYKCGDTPDLGDLPDYY